MVDTPTIELARTDEQIAQCYPVMWELRPHLADDSSFVRAVREMQSDGYHLAYLHVDGAAKSVAGYRLKRTFFCERFLYVDDLVTAAAERSRGYGRLMLDWLKAQARSEGCLEFHLDSGVHRLDAHRFYEREGLDKAAYHFLQKL